MKKLTFVLGVLLSVLTSAHAQLGSATTDLVYTPVTPCRLFDTRPTYGGAGAIATGGTSVFAVSGRTSYSSQGGSSTNCGMATAGRDARAIAIYLTVVTPAVPGWITAYQNGVTAPEAATVNFKAGDVLGNTTIVPVTPGGGGSANSSFMNIYASSATNVVGDIVGYYSKPISAGSLECIDTVQVNAPINDAFNTEFIGSALAPACPAGFNSVALRCKSNTALASASESTVEGQCLGRSLGDTASVSAKRTCCRISGR